MGRQSAGLGLVIVVLVAAVLVPAIAGRKTVGHAVALSIPAAPQVGECLRGLPSHQISGAATDSAPLAVPCSTAHDGEVITQTVTVVGLRPSKKGGGEIPDVAACGNTAYWYLGVHPLDGASQRSAVLGPWWPAFSAHFTALLPSPLQLRIGQSWAACVMVSPHGLITGSAAHLFGRPPRPSPFALCTKGSDIVLDESVPCDDPHTKEILGWRAADENTDPMTLRQSCEELAKRITGMTDPTARGALRSGIDIMPSADGAVRQGWAPGHARAYQAACTISPADARRLSGSLTGLGSAPVPWA